MSLTSCLKDPTSTMSRFLAEHLPSPGTALADYRRRLARFEPPRAPHAPTGQRPEYAMIGHTIDHRLRISLGARTGQPITEGITRTCFDDDGWPSLEIISTVHAVGLDLVRELGRYEAEEGRPLALDPAAEDRLVRLCHLASSFEAIYRCGGWTRGNSLGSCRPGDGLDDLAAAVPAYVVEDIRNQMALASSPGPFARLRALPPSRRICGPVFDGSLHVGGADADFILDGQLIDCKATIRPNRMSRAEVYQLAGYLLLDYSDVHGIAEVGLYLSRQGALIGWSVEEFLDLVGCRLTLRELRAACRHALSEGEEGTPPPANEALRQLPRPRNASPAAQEKLFDA
ncbi:hypothetical protein ACFCXA_17355 [Streptomyces virginiae]|uniref:hypothetical protein n=1 Tax=Streptomyces virginiae TaxID=1961 RepID=UPI0035DB06CC